MEKTDKQYVLDQLLTQRAGLVKQLCSFWCSMPSIVRHEIERIDILIEKVSKI